jgi:hypothetical protein
MLAFDGLSSVSGAAPTKVEETLPRGRQGDFSNMRSRYAGSHVDLPLSNL